MNFRTLLLSALRRCYRQHKEYLYFSEIRLGICLVHISSCRKWDYIGSTGKNTRSQASWKRIALHVHWNVGWDGLSSEFLKGKWLFFMILWKSLHIKLFKDLSFQVLSLQMMRNSITKRRCSYGLGKKSIFIIGKTVGLRVDLWDMGNHDRRSASLFSWQTETWNVHSGYAIGADFPLLAEKINSWKGRGSSWSVNRSFFRQTCANQFWLLL